MDRETHATENGALQDSQEKVKPSHVNPSPQVNPGGPRGWWAQNLQAALYDAGVDMCAPMFDRNNTTRTPMALVVCLLAHNLWTIENDDQAVECADLKKRPHG